MDYEIEDLTLMWKRHFAEQRDYIEEIRSIKHDMQGHLIVLHYYLESEKYEEAKSYIKQLKQNIDVVKNNFEIDLGNELVNIVIKECVAHSDCKLEVRSKGRIPFTTDVDDYDLCTIFYNLFKNAVEACEKLSLCERRIFIDIKTLNGGLEIEIKNPTEWVVSKDVLGKSTTKEEKKEHGYGLKNVMKTVTKYNGKIDFEISGNLFVARVKLKLKK